MENIKNNPQLLAFINSHMQSGLSNQGPVDIATLASQQSAKPINTLSQVVKTQQQIVQTPATNSNALNIQQIPQINSQI